MQSEMIVVAGCGLRPSGLLWLVLRLLAVCCYTVVCAVVAAYGLWVATVGAVGCGCYGWCCGTAGDFGIVSI